MPKFDLSTAFERLGGGTRAPEPAPMSPFDDPEAWRRMAEGLRSDPALADQIAAAEAPSSPGESPLSPFDDPEAWRRMAEGLRSDPALKSQIAAIENPGGTWIGDTYYGPETREAANVRNQERYLNDLSWLDPTFRYNPTTLGQSERSKVFADPEAQKAQWAALQRGAQMTDQELAFDKSGRQEAQYGNLQDIIGGGGATAIEMADRARQRADSEAWLRGQREADMADYAERGLTGSGMELLSLSSDRQAAAGRNSLADLEMAKALEQRRMDAINQAAGLAGTMRGQTLQEQIAARNAQESGLKFTSDLASQLRDTSFTEGQKRAEATDEFSLLNNEIINSAAQDNTQYVRDAQEQAMQRIADRERFLLEQKIGAASGVMRTDERENAEGFGQGTEVGIADTDAFNNAKSGYNNTFVGVATDALGKELAANQSENQQYPMAGEWGGKMAGAIGDTLLGGATGPTGGGGAAGGAAGGATSVGNTLPSTGSSNPYGVSAGEDYWTKLKLGK